MGYVSYLSDDHHSHKIVWCEQTKEDHSVVCVSDHASSVSPFGKADCQANRGLLAIVRTQVTEYNDGDVLLRPGCRPVYFSQNHDDHWDHGVHMRI